VANASVAPGPQSAAAAPSISSSRRVICLANPLLDSLIGISVDRRSVAGAGGFYWGRGGFFNRIYDMAKLRTRKKMNSSARVTGNSDVTPLGKGCRPSAQNVTLSLEALGRIVRKMQVNQ
jgi:hypothetical protein